MNRTERRTAAKQARRAKPTQTLYQRALQKANDSLAGLRLLDSARPFDPGDTTVDHIKTRAAFERLKTGAADDTDFDRVAIAINLAKIRALSIDPGLADMLERGQNAMTTVRERSERTGRFGFDGPGLIATAQAIDAHEAIADASSPLQMQLATRVMRQSILQNMRERAKARAAS